MASRQLTIGEAFDSFSEALNLQWVAGLNSRARLLTRNLAAAQRPVLMASAMRLAVKAGRSAYMAGRMPTREWAVPSSPSTGMLD